MQIKQRVYFLKGLCWSTYDLLAWAFLFFLPPVFFWRETLGWLTLGDADVVFWFFPAWKLGVDQIGNGEAPLWNPYLYSGTSFFAQWQAGLLDPLNWIHLFGPSSRTLTIAQEISFGIALFGAYGFTRRLGLRRRASVVAAVIFALSGFDLARTIYPGLFHIYALMPFVLLMIERLYQTGRWRNAAIGGLIVAWQIFAGHPQPLVYSSFLAGAYALFCAFVRRDPEPPESVDKEPQEQTAPVRQSAAARIRFLLQCAAIYVVGGALSAAQLAPAWEITKQSLRQQVPYEFFTWHSLHPISLLTAVIPYFHGQGKTIYHLPYWGSYWHHNEAQIYLGVIAISLAMASALCLWRERDRSVVFWSVSAVVAGILALGKYVGPVAWIMYHAPVVNQFRSPNRHWMNVTMAVSVLAGYAVDRFLSGKDRGLTRVTQISAVALSLLCAGVGVWVLKFRDQAESFIRALPDMGFLPKGFLQSAGPEFYVPAISAACMLGALVMFTQSRNRVRWYYLVLAALVIDFNLYATFAPITNPAKLESLIGRSMPSDLASKQSEREPIRYHFMLDPTDGVFNPFWFYGHEMATGYDPLMNKRYLNFSGVNEAGRSELPTLLDENDRTLDLLNVKYVLISGALLAPAPPAHDRLEYGGIRFANAPSSDVDLRADQSAVFSAPAAGGDTLAVVSALTNSVGVADGEEIAEIAVGCESGERTVTTLRAGRDTAEWAYDRSDVRAQIHHARAPLAASWPGDAGGSFQAHSYLARLPLPASVGRCGSARFVQIKSSAKAQVTVNIKQLALYDSGSGVSTPLIKSVTGGLRDTTRWRSVAIEGSYQGYRDLRVFENLKALPRVWLVDRVESRPDLEQLQLIRGQKKGMQERPFDPTTCALIDPADVTKVPSDLLAIGNEKGAGTKTDAASGTVNIVRREPTRMSLAANTTRPSLLVMSEVTFPGWRAKVDGQEVELLRADYLLRAINLAPGKHDVDIYYRPRTLVVGAAITIATALILLVLAVWGRWGRRAKPFFKR
jgi:hypothetical protein